MNKDFWTNKRVLITGHNGFKGCWLTKWLDMSGAETIGFALEPEERSGIRGLSLSRNHTEIIGDISDIRNLQILEDIKPEIVIHLAAQAIVGKAREYPLETFRTNLMGTVNLLEVLRGIGCARSIVVVTSDKVYKNIEVKSGYTEEKPLMGNEPYSCSKVCEEQAAKAYYESYFKERDTGVATARASNAFGGGDYHFDRLIPYLEECAYKKIMPGIRNPEAVRPWQYVLDLLNGYLVLAQKLYEDGKHYSGVYNFGPAREELYTVSDVADMICGNAIRGKKQDYYEAGLLYINSDKSYEKLGWRALFNIYDGIEETNKAYRAYFRKGNTDSLYEDRIKAFEEKMKRMEEN